MSGYDDKPIFNYPHYQEGVILPAGLLPPLTGYTNQEVLCNACNEAYCFLLENHVPSTIAKPAIYQISSSLLPMFEENMIEYNLSNIYSKIDVSVMHVINNLDIFSECIAITAHEISIHSISHLKIMKFGEQFIAKFTEKIPYALKLHILLLANELNDDYMSNEKIVSSLSKWKIA